MIKKDEARALITRNIGFLPYLVYIRWRYGLPCFFETHDFFGDLSLRTDLKKTPEILKKHWYEKIFLRHLDDVLGVEITHIDGDSIIGHIIAVVEIDEVSLGCFPQIVHPADHTPVIG